MKNASSITALTAAIFMASLVAFPSCKKKNNDDEYGTLNGRMKYDLPSYVHPGETYSITPHGVSHPEGKNLGYYVYRSWATSSYRDTLRYCNSSDTSPITYTLQIPDKLGTGYDFAFHAYADDYYSTSMTTSLTIVGEKMEEVFSGLDYSDSDPSFTDPRDDMEYRTVTIGSDEWFRQNLSYADCGVPFSNAPAMTRITGNFYSWDEAVSSCPEGWHLSTGEDWLALGKLLTGDEGLSVHDSFPGVSGDLMVDAKFFGTRMWEYWPNDVTITNKYLFNALSFGYANTYDEGAPRFEHPNEYAAFWTADEDENDSSKAWLRYFHYKQSDVMTTVADKGTFLANVRCVRDRE